MQFKSLLIATAVVMGSVIPARSLTVSPGRTEARLTPGTGIKTVLTVTNDSKDKLQVQVTTKDWFVFEENKKIPTDQWLQVKGSKYFWLKPGKSRKIKVKLFCPKEGQGEFVGMVSFLYQTDEVSMVTPVISVSMYLAVDGTEKKAGEISDLAVRLWENKLQAVAVVKSTGNVHLRPNGYIAFTDDKGQKVGNFIIPEGDPAYPGQVRGYLAQVPSEFKLNPGRYTVTADLNSQALNMKSSRGLTVLVDGSIKMDEVKKESQ